MTTQTASLAGPGEGIAGSLGEPATALAADALALVAELSDEVSQLKVALHSNRRIGMAMGLLMAQLGVTDDEAFDALRTISQNTNRKLRDVADDVITRRRIYQADQAVVTAGLLARSSADST
jgi:AmiR/NasT family two-component response regulator